MNRFDYFLFKIGLLRLHRRWLERQMYFKNIEAIEFAIQHGLYDVRKSAVEFLGKNNSERSIPVLVEAIGDEVQVVSEAAMEALRNMNSSVEILMLIEKKKQFWIQRAEDAKSKLVTENYINPSAKNAPARRLMKMRNKCSESP